MENKKTTSQRTPQPFKYRRVSKTPSLETRERIASALRGKPKSTQTKERISTSLKQYWSDPDNFPADSNESGDTSFADIM